MDMRHLLETAFPYGTLQKMARDLEDTSWATEEEQKDSDELLALIHDVMVVQSGGYR